MKKFFKNFYLLLIFLFLYAPIVVLMIFSFNDSKSRRLWDGFTTRWYVELFRDADILHSLYVTLLVAVAAAAIATVLGTIAAIGIHNMGRQSQGGLPDRQQHPDVLVGYHHGRNVHAAVCRHRSGQGLPDPYPRARYVLHAVCRAPMSCPSCASWTKTPMRPRSTSALHHIRRSTRSSCRRLCRASSRALSWRSLCQSTISWCPTLPPGTTSQPLSVVIYSMTRHRMTPKINAISTILFLIVLALLIVINVRQSRDEKRREAARRKGAMQP